MLIQCIIIMIIITATTNHVKKLPESASFYFLFNLELELK